MPALARLAVVVAFAAATLAGCSGGSGTTAPGPPESGSVVGAPVAPSPPTSAPQPPSARAPAAPTAPASAHELRDFCSTDAFCWAAPAPSGASLSGVWVASATDAWAVGPRGGFLRWNGSEWKWVRTGYDGHVHAIWGAGSDDVWAVGDAILHFDGTRWSVARPATGGGSFLAVHGSGPRDVWAVGTDSSAAHFDGSAWTDVTLPFAAGSSYADALDVYVAAPGVAWAVGSGSGAVLQLGQRGWQQVSGVVAGETKAVWGSGADDVWIAGAARYEPRQPRIGHNLHHWDGTAWTGVAVPGAEDAVWVTVAGSSAREVWLVGESPRDLAPNRARFDGQRWVTSRVEARATAAHVDSGAGGGFAVGHGGAVARLQGDGWAVQHRGWDRWLNDVATRDGVAWIPVLDFGVGTRMLRFAWGAVAELPPLVDDIVYAVSPVASSALWAATYSGGLTFFDGQRWTAQVGGITGPVSGVWASGPSDVWAARGRDVVHWDGASATTYALGTEYLGPLWGSAPDDVWAVGDVGSAHHWDGTTWTRVALPVGALPLDVWGRSRDDVWIAGYDGLALHFDGQTWSRIETGSHATLNGVTGDDRGNVWLAGDDGVVLEWTGAGFRELDSGTFGSINAAAWDPALGLVLAVDEGVLSRGR